jgi:hypothetical protein
MLYHGVVLACIRKAGRDCVGVVQTWLQSLMKYAETIEESNVATRNLYAYVKGRVFITHCGQAASDALSAWLANSFFNVENKLLFYFRKNLRHFDEYVNSLCEGQNSAMKTTSTGTKALFAIDTCCNAMDFRAVEKTRKRAAVIEKKKHSTPLYSNTEASLHITPYAELLAHKECEPAARASPAYWVWKTGSHTAMVLLKKHQASRSPGIFVPVIWSILTSLFVT